MKTKKSSSHLPFLLLGISLFFVSCVTLRTHEETESPEDAVLDEIILLKADTAIQKKDYQEALQLYNQIYQTSFSKTNRMESLKRTLDIQIEQYKDADAALLTFKELRTKYGKENIHRGYYLPILKLIMTNNRYAETIQFALEYSGRERPLAAEEAASVAYILGISYLESGKQKDAIYYLSKAAETLPSDGRRWRSLKILARIYWDKYSDRETSYRYLADLIKLRPLAARDPEVKLLLKMIQWQYIDKKDGLKDDCISAIAFDGDEIWAGSWLGGAFKFTRSRNTFKIYNTRNGLVADLIRDIKTDNDTIWIATFEGVSRFNKKNNTWNNFQSIPGVAYQRIKSILVQERYVWICTLGTGIQRFDKMNNTWTDYSNQPQFVVRVREDPWEGLIGFATLNSGFLLLEKGKWRRLTDKNPPLNSNLAKDIAFDKEKIYLATYKEGIFILDRKDGNIQPLTLPKKYFINTMILRNGKLYLGTLGDGLVIYDLASGTTKSISIRDGMNSNYILALEFEKDYIWIGTIDSGINIYYSPEP